MEGKFKRFFLLPAVVAIAWTAAAQNVTFEVNAPQVVAVGEVFRVEFITNTEPKKFIDPTFEGIDLLAGPSMSQSRHVTVVNGNMERTNKYSYMYVLQCNTEGEFTISPAGIEVGNKTYSTPEQKVKAITEAEPQAQGAGAGAGAGTGDRQEDRQKAVIAPDDILFVPVVDKTRVFKGEPVKVSFKLYSRVQVGGVEGARPPSFNGFWKQQLDTRGYGVQRETYNNKIYDSWVLSEYLAFPQMAGTLTIDPFDITVVAQIITQQRRQSILDDFFGGPDIQEVRRKVSSQPVTITVNELPSGAPDSFNGAVGEFEMQAILPPAEIAANSAVTYNVKISGRGNLPQIQAPKMQLPASFEQYNIKTTESLNDTPQGIYGYRQFEYPVIARVVGEYDLKPIEFTYFNPGTTKYETLSSKPLTLSVVPDSTSVRSNSGMVSGVSKEDIKFLGRDIRFIKLGQANLQPKGRMFMWSFGYFLAVVVIAALFIFLLVWLRKYLAERRNSALIKGKRANKVALQRFRAAERYMNEDNQRGFYDEMLKALWGYMSDKLNIPAANLTKENVRDELVKKGVSQDMAARYIDIISDCEYAQYAPSASGKMHEAYGLSVELVSKLESIIGR